MAPITYSSDQLLGKLDRSSSIRTTRNTLRAVFGKKNAALFGKKVAVLIGEKLTLKLTHELAGSLVNLRTKDGRINVVPGVSTGMLYLGSILSFSCLHVEGSFPLQLYSDYDFL
jgi:hypothetical protein